MIMSHPWPRATGNIPPLGHILSPSAPLATKCLALGRHIFQYPSDMGMIFYHFTPLVVYYGARKAFAPPRGCFAAHFRLLYSF